MSQKEHTVKCRYTVLNERDEVAFDRILHEEYPSLRYVCEDNYWTDDIPIYEHLWDCPRNYVNAFITPEGWQPLILSESTRLGPKYHLHLPRQHFRIHRSHWDWVGPGRKYAFEVPTLREGHVEGAFWRENDEDQRLFLVRVWRLLSKISSRHMSRWCGLDALRYTQETARRMLDACIRPDDDWVFPEDNPYYRDELWDDIPPTEPFLPVSGTPWEQTFDREPFYYGPEDY